MKRFHWLVVVIAVFLSLPGSIVLGSETEERDSIFEAVLMGANLNKDQIKQVKEIEKLQGVGLAELRNQALQSYTAMQGLLVKGILTGVDLQTAIQTATDSLKRLMDKRIEVLALIKVIISAEQWNQVTTELTLDDLSGITHASKETRSLSTISGKRQASIR